MNHTTDFIIKKDELVKYTGPGGTIEFPLEAQRVKTGAFNSAKTPITHIIFPGKH